jgi:hypothetical protein
MRREVGTCMQQRVQHEHELHSTSVAVKDLRGGETDMYDPSKVNDQRWLAS